MALRKIRLEEARRIRWRNDGGWTREIAMGRVGGPGLDASGERWDWRISVAEIEQDGPFSRFPGVDRCLLLLDGAGMELTGEDGHARQVVPARARVDFAGDVDVRCRLLAGPTRDLNLMWRRAELAARIDVQAVDGAVELRLADDIAVAVLHVLKGRIDVGGQSLAAADTLVASAPLKKGLHAAGSADLAVAMFIRKSAN